MHVVINYEFIVVNVSFVLAKKYLVCMSVPYHNIAQCLCNITLRLDNSLLRGSSVGQWAMEWAT